MDTRGQYNMIKDTTRRIKWAKKLLQASRGHFWDVEGGNARSSNKYRNLIVVFGSCCFNTLFNRYSSVRAPKIE